MIPSTNIIYNKNYRYEKIIIVYSHNMHWNNTEIGLNKPENESPIIQDEFLYFNCVWGWNGSNNGHFLYNNTSLDSYNNLKIVHGFTPDK